MALNTSTHLPFISMIVPRGRCYLAECSKRMEACAEEGRGWRWASARWSTGKWMGWSCSVGRAEGVFSISHANKLSF